MFRKINQERVRNWEAVSSPAGEMHGKLQNTCCSDAGVRQKILGTLVSRIVATSFDLDPADLLSCNRGTAAVARARQVAAYILHTGFSMKLTDVAKFFSRDRTTIGHACRLVEDLRDNPVFDKRIRFCEETIELVEKLNSWSVKDETREQ